MKKFVLSAAILAIFTGGMTTAVSFVTAGTAMACPVETAAYPSAALARSLPQVNPGDRGHYVLALQLALRGEGYDYLQGTGAYANNTLRAVKDFQAKHGIKASGIVGSKTWMALVGPKPTSGTSGSRGLLEPFTLQPGQRSDTVAWLTNMLSRIYPYVRQMQDLPEFDVYGPELQKMVRDFQKRAGIKASGIVGPKTVAAMDEVIAVSGNWGC